MVLIEAEGRPGRGLLRAGAFRVGAASLTRSEKKDFLFQHGVSVALIERNFWFNIVVCVLNFNRP